MRKYKILGVSMGWEERKGLDVFLQLHEKLKEDFQIILVGTDEKVNTILPKDIVSIPKTNNQIELSKLYSEADLVVNPSREDNYPTVNIEANCCGTAVIGFDIGGVAETIFEGMGQVVPLNDIDEMIFAIHKWKCIKISEKTIRKCREHNSNKRMVEEYTSLYKRIVGMDNENKN